MATCICDIITNGSIICLNVEDRFKVTGSVSATNIEVTITLPLGTTYSSDNPSHGTVDITNPLIPIWNIPSLLVDDEAFLGLCITVTDVIAFSATDRLATAVVTTYPGEVDTSDNTITRKYKGTTCDDLANCTQGVIVTATILTLLSEQYVEIDTSLNSVTVTLPAAPVSWRPIHIKLQDNTNTATIDPNGSTIDGAATVDMSVNDETLKVVYNGTDWSIY